MIHHLFITPTKAADFIRPIPGWSNYFADRLGNIYSTHGGGLRVKAQRPRPNKYLAVNLSDGNGNFRTMTVHHLVALAFIGPRPAGMLVCHTPDPTKTNNRADNLRYQTRLQNAEDSRRDGTTQHPRRKLNPASVREIRALEGTMSKAAIARRYGVGPDLVRFVLNRRCWAHVE